MKDNSEAYNENAIIEGSKLIAEFMGIKPNPFYYIPEHILWFFDTGSQAYHQGSNFKCDELEYHSSWKWLVPVVAKIVSDVHNQHSYYHIGTLLDRCYDAVLVNDVSTAFTNAVKIIKWYNTNNQ